VMGKAETYIVAAKVTILVAFAVIGLFFVKGARLSPADWKPPVEILFATAIAFIGFQGFGLVTNTAGDMQDPKRDLPRALYISFAVSTVIYLLVAITVIGSTSLSKVTGTSGDVLSVVAQGFLGKFGFYALAVAALLSTASAVNATLFGSANIAYQVAKDGQLPKDVFMEKLWNRNVEGLFITAALVIGLLLVFNLAPISMMASGAFLVVYASVNAAHLRITKTTGARPWLILTAAVLTGAMFIVLLVYMVEFAPSIAWITLVASFVVSFVLEWVYRRFAGRTFKSILSSNAPTGRGRRAA
jgi:amino acid transporter